MGMQRYKWQHMYRLQAMSYKSVPATLRHVCMPTTAWDVDFVNFRKPRFGHVQKKIGACTFLLANYPIFSNLN